MRVLEARDRPPSLVDVACTAGTWTRATWSEGVVRLVDAHLREAAARPFTTDDLAGIGPACKDPDARARLLAASPDLRRLAFSHAGGLVVVDGDVGVRVAVPADAAARLGDHLLVTTPARDGHRVLLVTWTGEVLDESLLDADDARAFIPPHPDGVSGLIECAMGQDGCVVARVAVTADALTCTEVLPGEDAVVAGFSPEGGRVLIAAHPN